MKELEEGHVYELSNFDENGRIQKGSIGSTAPYAQEVIFMRRTNEQVDLPGTTNEEVLTMMLHRMKYLDKRLPCKENKMVITKLEEALMWLHQRTNKRVVQGVETTDKPHQSD